MMGPMALRTPPSPLDDPPSVAELMARMAAGDTAAVFALNEHHGHRIAGAVRTHLRECGVYRITPEDLQSLVLDACIELLAVAPAWRPGWAQPWNWAWGRIRGVVAAWVGTHALSLDGERPELDVEVPAAAPSTEDSLAEAFARLVEDEPLVRLVAEAAQVARVDDVALVCLLDYRVQQDQGDPSPAHTLAARYGVHPDTLRQRISRGRRRLREVVRTDPRFAAIADLELVA